MHSYDHNPRLRNFIPLSKLQSAPAEGARQREAQEARLREETEGEETQEEGDAENPHGQAKRVPDLAQ